MEVKNWPDERLKVIIIKAIAHHAHGDKGKAVQLLGDALALSEPGGFIRTFVDEGPSMESLLKRIKGADGRMKEYIRKLLAAFTDKKFHHPTNGPQHMIEPLSERELEVLNLISKGLTNQEIASRLFISLNTIKAHTRNIYSKIGVNNRTHAVTKA